MDMNDGQSLDGVASRIKDDGRASGLLTAPRELVLLAENSRVVSHFTTIIFLRTPHPLYQIIGYDNNFLPVVGSCTRSTFLPCFM